MPQNYSQAMSDSSGGSPHEFAFLVSGILIFLLLNTLWEKWKKTDPPTGYVFVATVATLFLLPVAAWYYLCVFTIVLWIGSFIWKVIQS